ncbi:MAG TPA: UDP binding domain-containing protein, partial [Methanosarcina sp.]|nr:UDP binding domain-containing protein [Methanosarcina sp.]
GEGITRAVLWPEAGVGGHCLTKDTYHLERGVKIGNGHLDYPAGADSIYVLARKINDFMPVHMYNLTVSALERVGKKMNGSKIAMLGWAFIRDSDDARNTPSEPYRNLCLKAGAKIAVHDPYVVNYPGVEISDKLDEVIKDADAVVFLAGHSAYFNLKADWIKKIAGKKNPVVIDGRNIIEPEMFIGKGFVYKGIGRGDKNEHLII